jgi:hypothetical protein
MRSPSPVSPFNRAGMRLAKQVQQQKVMARTVSTDTTSNHEDADSGSHGSAFQPSYAAPLKLRPGESRAVAHSAASTPAQLLKEDGAGTPRILKRQGPPATRLHEGERQRRDDSSSLHRRNHQRSPIGNGRPRDEARQRQRQRPSRERMRDVEADAGRARHRHTRREDDQRHGRQSPARREMGPSRHHHHQKDRPPRARRSQQSSAGRSSREAVVEDQGNRSQHGAGRSRSPSSSPDVPRRHRRSK